jgi:hypothetical protein
MRRLEIHADWMGSEAELLRMISDNSPNGIMCPGLRELEWKCYIEPLPFFRLFLSPHLTTFSFRYSWFLSQVSDEILANLTPAILELPASSLQSLTIEFITPNKKVSTFLESALSSTVLRCGPSLTSLYVEVPLSDAAVQHVIKLPKLTSWKTVNGPPRTSDLSLSDAFPQLETLKLLTEASLEWIPFLGAISRHPSLGQSSNRGPGQKPIVLESWVDIPVDAAFMSPIMQLHGLVELGLRSTCFNGNGCTFGLTDKDVAEIAIALPRLRDAAFGHTCSANSCRTTVSSLLSLSTHCKDLEELQIHFNTINLLGDLTPISEDLRLRDAHSLPKCGLRTLDVWNAPLRIGAEDRGPVAAGFLGIFPSLSVIITNLELGWESLLEYGQHQT